ncbi:thioesterase [Streptomyces sp. NRRL F-5755]|uniref:thioesterase II family protein n=1 Tax=Streptomyces sp. NRRL F-5755 TaxID=1519475 RepID=UPI0006ADE372|nr:thioesterase domain-containing protein [Streptomyces sp. NRRL F-5755]KOT93206.1 thioesterase [Streptomyces sp. NRRL F-5755]
MSSWWTTIGGGTRPAARFRVVALPHAGGWPSAFRSWWQVLPADVELVVAQLPGRGARIGEQPLTRVEPLVDALARCLADLPELPYAVIGHSFGSVLAYELTRTMEQKGLAPELLAVSARQPPCFAGEPPSTHLRSDADLLEHLLDIGGIAPQLMDRADLVRPSLRAIRADLEAMERYERPLSGTGVPILALGAADDPVVDADRLHLWSLETTGGFRRLMFTGGHFYLYEAPHAAAVARHLVAGRTGAPGGGRVPRPPRRPAPLPAGDPEHSLEETS